jgi:hypothetical protein
MPDMNATYRNAIATEGASLITHIGLVDEAGEEIDGGDPAYARQSVTWAAADNGRIQLDANLTFNVPADTTVGGWRGYSASTEGTNYGGKDLTNESFAGQGTYTLQASGTWIDHVTPS